jgi:DNA-binding HxlR family transcriptional regulator
MSNAKPIPNIFSSACPSRRVMAVLAEKWTLLILTALDVRGAMRTAELRRCVDGVSEKMLIQTLRKLESFGLVSRRSFPEVPPRVEYKLTPLGRSLARLAGLFGRWVEKNVGSLLKAEKDAA